MKVLALPIVLAVLFSGAASGDKDKRPKLSVKATPAMAFSPARIVVTADVNGGADDNEEFYCPGVQWEWGDGTTSEQSADCDPYVAGKSEIKRRFTTDHTYTTQGEYRIQLRLKRSKKVIAAASTSVKVRPGIGDPGGGLRY
jgi:hypothetical protein